MFRGGGVGLGGLLIVIAALYFTGAGSWMLNRIQNLPDQCYAASMQIAPSIGDPICRGLGKAVTVVVNYSNSASASLHALREKILGGGSSSSSTGTSSLGSSIQESIASLSSSADQLQQMISDGPQQITGGNAGQQFQRAVDSFTIGQQYASSGNAAQAIPWLQQGARQPRGFGVMSQLSLANMYRVGGRGVAADPVKAQTYYGLASNSLGELSQSNTPEAQQLLQTFPASPQAVQQEIAQTIASMKNSIHR